MPRADLLALTPDDLASLTNRGTVKRAQKELESGDPKCEIVESQGELVVTWSDGVTCRFPAGKTVHEAICSSGTLGISRHIVRSVLAYQQTAETSQPTQRVAKENPPSNAPSPDPSAPDQTADDQPAHDQLAEAPSSPESEQVTPGPVGSAVWDPGAISDETLTTCFRKPAVAQARKRFEQGVLVELTRGAKPVARFLDEGFTIRFLVPGDPRYISSDCAEALLPVWVPIAVFAFRELAADRVAGLLCLRQSFEAVPPARFAPLNALISELVRDGLSEVAETWSPRIMRVEESLRGEGFVWLAELIVDLVHQEEMYRQHDARFDMSQAAFLIGEIVARTQALANHEQIVPRPLISGSKADRPAEIAGGRMIGIGLGLRPARSHTTLSAYLQDVDSGAVLAVERTYANAEDKDAPPRMFADLAQTAIVRGISPANLATSQLLIKSGKRTPGGQLVLPRTAAQMGLHPQSYQWEQLKPPLLAECFSQLAARLETLPPSALRPRRATENLFVVAVRSLEQAEFDVANQAARARLHDIQGEVAELVHPFHARGRDGFNDLVDVLQHRGSQVKFVAGHVRARGGTLEIQPVGLIVDDGQRRQMVVPWLRNSAKPTVTAADPIQEVSAGAESRASRTRDFISRLDEALGDLLLTGLTRGSDRPWKELSDVGQQIGFVRLVQPIAVLGRELESRGNTLQWSSEKAIAAVKRLCLLSRLAADV